MSDAPDGMRRYYTEACDESGKKKWFVSYVTVEPKKCSRCGELIRPNCYFVHRSAPGGTGACWECRDQATDYERFQLERGQAGLNEWLKENAAKRESTARLLKGRTPEDP